MRFEQFLSRGVRSFWATSYSFDLRLFDQYLLRRVSQAALNAVVLVDHDKLAGVWEHLDEGETYLAKQAGRRYLLRGVHLASGGAFHPKSYLFAQREHAALLVGSGNLTRDGIDHGHEVFVTFTTERDDDLPTMRAWANWIGRLVQTRDDPVLTYRWSALRDACPWMLGSADGAKTLTNENEPLIDQLLELLPVGVTELHVTAPFFDREAVALRDMLLRSQPERVAIYMGADASVHGPSLAAVLGLAHDVRVLRFQPPVFVHAKLIGAIGNDGRGVLLSGSPNLSQAALTRTYVEAGGNCEVAVVQAGDAAEIRASFEGSGLELVEVSLDSLEAIQFSDDHPSLARRFLLRGAEWLGDGRIQLDVGTSNVAAGAKLAHNDSDTSYAISTDGKSIESLTDVSPTPLLVWIVNGSGDALSNKVVIDDPAALEEALREPASKRNDSPPELEDLDASPLIRLVLWAHEKFIFDPNRTAALRRARERAGEENQDKTDGKFWKKYAQEELHYDPRASSYKPLTPGGNATPPIDELLRQLELLLHQAPGVTSDTLIRVLTGDADSETDGAGTGTPWSMEARYRVRAYNLLMRWARAVEDPEVTLIAPNAPVTNYETLLGVTFLAWLNTALELHQLRRLLLTLMESFIGRAPGHGFLGRVDDGARTTVLASLDNSFIEIVAGLVYVALTVTGWTEDIYDWQPALQRGVELGVILGGALSVPVVQHLTGSATDELAIDATLEHRSKYVDDKTWAMRLANELELHSVVLERFDNPKVPLAAKISGAVDFLHDPRVLTVARRVADFKGLAGVVVFVGSDRFIFQPGLPGRVVIGGPQGDRYQTDAPADVARLREVEEQGGAVADLFGLAAQTAA